MQPKIQFKVRDRRNKGWFYLDNEYLNGYARIFGPVGTAIYVSLCRHADNDSQSCFPTHEKIAAELNIDKRTVIRHISAFEEYRLIAVVRSKDKDTNRQLPNTYFLLDKDEWKRPGDIESHGKPGDTNAESRVTLDAESRVTQSHTKDTHLKENKTHIKETHLAPEAGANVASKEIVALHDAFRGINPSISYSHRTSRAAAAWLIERFGFPAADRLTRYAVSVQGRPYAPVITTPYQLKEKLAALRIYSQRETDSKSPKVLTL